MGHDAIFLALGLTVAVVGGVFGTLAYWPLLVYSWHWWFG
jgi:hypothetical protein